MLHRRAPRADTWVCPYSCRGKVMADTTPIESTFDRIDRVVTRFMAETGLTLLRISIGIVYIWFGVLKVIGISPAAPLITEAWDYVPFSPDLFVRLIGGLEVLIGLGFLFGIAMRLIIFLMLMQMLGAFSPLVLAPGRL